MELKRYNVYARNGDRIVHLEIKAISQDMAKQSAERCYRGLDILTVAEISESVSDEKRAVLESIERHNWLTVKQYAILEEISVQAVYKRLNKKENRKYIIHNTAPLKIKKSILGAI